MHNTRHFGVRLFLYTLMPTALEVCWCLVAGSVIVTLQFGKYSILNTVGNNISQSIVGTTYRSDVLAPFHRFTGNSTVMTIMLELLWSVIGVVVYELASFAVKRFTDWENAEHNARFSPFGTIEHYPIVRLFLGRWLWRIVMGIVILTFSVFVVPYLYRHILTGIDIYMISATKLVAQILEIVLVWSLIFHVYIVLFRLYVTRVRLFGKIVY